MKKTRIFTITILMVFLLSITIFADGKRSSSNLFLFNDSVNTTDSVSGDVYALAQDININSTIGGDVVSAGQDISINSQEILGNVRIAGQNLDIDIKNTKNMTLAGQNIEIGEDTNCNAIYAASQNIDFKGTTNDLYASAQEIIIDGKVNGNLEVSGEKIVITENADVLGSVTIKSQNEPVINGNMASKDINYEKIDYKLNFRQENRFDLVDTVMSIITAIIVALLLFVIFKNYFYKVEKSLDSSMAKYILVGLGALIIIPILIVMLCITVIGIPISLVLLFLYILAIYISPMISGITIGQRVLKGQNKYLQVVCGVVAIKLIILVPFIHSLVWFVCVMFTLGSISVEIVNKISSKTN